MSYLVDVLDRPAPRTKGASKKTGRLSEIEALAIVSKYKIRMTEADWAELEAAEQALAAKKPAGA